MKKKAILAIGVIVLMISISFTASGAMLKKIDKKYASEAIEDVVNNDKYIFLIKAKIEGEIYEHGGEIFFVNGKNNGFTLQPGTIQSTFLKQRSWSIAYEGSPYIRAIFEKGFVTWSKFEPIEGSKRFEVEGFVYFALVCLMYP